MPIGAVIGAGALQAGATVYSASKASSASKSASQAQQQANDQAMAEQRRQYDVTRSLLQPYIDAADPALKAQMALLGLLGDVPQQQAVAQQEQSPMFQALALQGENAILQQASATGGLRGGNVQGALGQFRPSLLNSFIDQQYNRLGGITALGQNAAAGVGNAGMQSAANIGNLMMQSGAAQAGGIMGAANAQQQMIGGLSTQFGSLIGNLNAQGAFGGSSFDPNAAVSNAYAANANLSRQLGF